MEKRMVGRGNVEEDSAAVERIGRPRAKRCWNRRPISGAGINNSSTEQQTSPIPHAPSGPPSRKGAVKIDSLMQPLPPLAGRVPRTRPAHWTPTPLDR